MCADTFRSNSQINQNDLHTLCAWNRARGSHFLGSCIVFEWIRVVIAFVCFSFLSSFCVWAKKAILSAYQLTRAIIVRTVDTVHCVRCRVRSCIPIRLGKVVADYEPHFGIELHAAYCSALIKHQDLWVLKQMRTGYTWQCICLGVR